MRLYATVASDRGSREGDGSRSGANARYKEGIEAPDTMGTMAPERRRPVNFSAGPAVLPELVLRQASEDLVGLPGVGISPLEISHRSSWFTGVIEEAEANLRGLLGLRDDHRVLFLQGGASLQFSMVPMDLLRGTGRRAEYVVTGSWGEKAVREGAREGDVAVAWSGADHGFTRIPSPGEVVAHADAAYLHVTSNETIQCVEFPETWIPRAPSGIPLICDASSDFLSRPIDPDRYGLLYAGAQKNAGPSGLTVVIVGDEVLDRIPDGLPTMLDYRTHVAAGSRYNTPPVFSVYVLLLVSRWLRDDIGGLEKMAELNEEKASLLYDEIDTSEGFYRGHADADARSRMNVTWRLASDELEARFLEEAAERDLVELKGHRSVGGIRASIYNAMPPEGVEALAGFMRAFAAANA
jgi:phosphoserine aminotransferase